MTHPQQEKSFEKTIVFRHSFVMYFRPAETTDAQARSRFIEQCFAKGYVPMEPKIQRDPQLVFSRVISAPTAYAGKKLARQIGVQPRPDISEIPLRAGETNQPLS